MNRISDKQFSLYRLKMTCCSADTVPLKVRMIAPQALSGYKDHEWVRHGQVEFHEVGEGNVKRYLPVIRVPATTEAYITKIKAQSEYE